MSISRDIGVLGGGVAGLAAAVALARKGFEVTVYEQAPEIREVGAGLQISPNGAAVLGHLGLTTALVEAGVRAQAVELVDGPAGKSVARFDLSEGVGGHGYYFLHRADLVTMLGKAAWNAGATLVLGRKAESVQPSENGTEIAFENGSSARHDIVIAADGVHSVARSQVHSQVQPKFSGQVAWRALVRSDVPPDPVARVHMGPGRHLVHYPLAGGRLINIVGVEERDDWVADGWATRDEADNLRRAFSGYDQPVRDLLERVEDVHLWGLHLYPVLPSWTRDTLVLIGDAAHPTLPFMAQGATQAMEDAGVVAEILAASSDLRSAFDRFESLRINRVTRVIAAARANAVNYHRTGVSKLATHSALKMGQRLAPGMIAQRFDWIYSYDAIAQAASSSTTGT